MAKFRLAEQDKRKSLFIIKRQIENSIECCIDRCNKPVSQMSGPGSDVLCRKHQLFQIEYGGMGRIDRLHTFHRLWVCSKCGWDAWNDPRYAGLTDDQKSTAIRMVMHGHHAVTRQADGGDHSAENVVGECIICHAIDTTINKDYLKNKPTT